MAGIISLDIFFRAVVSFLFIVRQLYWILKEHKAHRLKQKTQPPTFRSICGRVMTFILGYFMLAQLLGWNLFQFQQNIAVQSIGFFLASVGVIISMRARKTLGANWTQSSEYQIKKEQELVTSGVYRYIRHPIYLGIFLSFVGAELIAHSYLAIFFAFLLFFTSYRQGKKEESILKIHLGKEYEDYMKETKMFFPYIF